MITKQKCLHILNGPNLDQLGKREVDIYGKNSLAEIKKACDTYAKTKKYDLYFSQTNQEGTLIEEVHNAQKNAAGLILNPAAYGHTSLALYDALKMLEEIPVIEVHLSVPVARESFRQVSYVSQLANGIISGLGMKSYLLAIDAAIWLIEQNKTEQKYR